MIVKSVVLVAAYIVPFILLLVFTPPFWTGLLFWVVMGFGISGIGMSVMHDANHGAFSKNPKVNKWIGNTLYLAGAGVMNWKVQHNVLHHTYTNVPKVDQDIQDRGIVKLAPKSEVRPLHRFQWFYAFFFYGLLTFYWVILKDFVQYYSFTSSGLIPGLQYPTTSVNIRFSVPPLLANAMAFMIRNGFDLMYANFDCWSCRLVVKIWV